MTYEQAVAIRSRQLSGKPMSALVVAEAVWVIRDGEHGKRQFSAIRFAIDNEQVRLLMIELRLL